MIGRKMRYKRLWPLLFSMYNISGLNEHCIQDGINLYKEQHLNWFIYIYSNICAVITIVLCMVFFYCVWTFLVLLLFCMKEVTDWLINADDIFIRDVSYPLSNDLRRKCFDDTSVSVYALPARLLQRSTGWNTLCFDKTIAIIDNHNINYLSYSAVGL